MKLLLRCIVFACAGLLVSGRLEPTKLIDQHVYKLENQHDGSYLTHFGSDKVGKKYYTGNKNQQWLFTFVKNYPGEGQEAWKIMSVTNETSMLSDNYWKVKLVGHGKRTFRSYSNSKCLRNTASGVAVDGSCDRNDGRQRWFLHDISEK